jgi:hypothetical protein
MAWRYTWYLCEGRYIWRPRNCGVSNHGGSRVLPQIFDSHTGNESWAKELCRCGLCL